MLSQHPCPLQHPSYTPGPRQATGRSARWGKVGKQQLEGAAGMAESGRGVQGTVLSPHGITAFRSESPPCPTNPALWMQQQSLERDKSTGIAFSDCSFKSWGVLKIGPFFTNFSHLGCPGTQVAMSWPTKHSVLLLLRCSPRPPISNAEDAFVRDFELLRGLGGRVGSPEGGRLHILFMPVAF